MACCNKLNCAEVCDCIFLTSDDNSLNITNSSVIIGENGCIWDLSVDYSNIPFPETTNDVVFNPTTRELCSTVNGVQSCVIIPNDDEYLQLDGTTLSIYASDDTLLSSVDLSPILVQTPFAANSASLVITAGGTLGHSPNIELVPSIDANNALILGSDGKPYVAEATQNPIVPVDTNTINLEVSGVNNNIISGAVNYQPTDSINLTENPGGLKADLILDPTSTADVSITADGLKVNVPQNIDVEIDPIPGLSFSKSISGNVITFTPVFDFVYIASQTCPLCPEPEFPCAAPTVTLEVLDDASITVTVTPLASGDSYDISLDGGLTWPITGITTVDYTVGNLGQNSTHIFVIRLYCVAGGNVETAPQSETTEDCGAATGFNITDFSGTFTATAFLSWTAAINNTTYSTYYKLSSDLTYTSGPSTNITSTSITGLLVNRLYDFTVVSICHFGNNDITGPIQGIDLVCPTTAFTASSNSQTTIQYAFPNYLGTSISNVKVDLLNSTGTTVLQTQNKIPPANTGTFSGLTAGTTYRVRLTLQAQGTSQLFTSQCATQRTVTTNSPAVTIYARLEYQGTSSQSCIGNQSYNFARTTAYWRTYSDAAATIPYNLPGGSNVIINYDRRRLQRNCNCPSTIITTTDDIVAYNFTLTNGVSQTLVPNAQKYTGLDWFVCNNVGSPCIGGGPGGPLCANANTENLHFLDETTFGSVGTTAVNILPYIVI